MAKEGIISRHVYAVVPPKVEYGLTARGKSLIAVICTMETLGVDFVKNSGKIYDTDCLRNGLITLDQ